MTKPRKSTFAPIKGITADEYRQLLERQERPHADLEDYLKESPFGLSLVHPLVRLGQIDPDRAAMANSMYLAKSKAVAKAFEKRDWPSYILLHERPYRLDAF